MAYLVLAVNPAIAAWGQLAAIIICFYAVIFVLLAVVFNLVSAIAMGWVREKINIIKLLRPTVNSLNETTNLSVKGGHPDANTNKIISSVAEGPATVHTIDKKVDEGADKVAQYVIEFRARTEQFKAIAQTLLFPGASSAKRLSASATSVPHVDSEGLEFNSPGYRALMKEKVPEYNDVPASDKATATSGVVTASRLKK